MDTLLLLDVKDERGALWSISADEVRYVKHIVHSTEEYDKVTTKSGEEFICVWEGVPVLIWQCLWGVQPRFVANER